MKLFKFRERRFPKHLQLCVPDMKLQTTIISVQSSARTNTVCGDHFNEVVSLHIHTFPIKKNMRKGKSI